MLKVQFGLLRSLISGIILFSGMFSSMAFAATTKTGDICVDYYGSGSYTTNCVKSADINAAAVTNAKIAAFAVTGANIATSTITGGKIASGTITGSNIAAGTITPSNIQPVANRVVVAVSGGDYTTISAALAAINPSASTPYVIDVMPGTYAEKVTMKSYVNLRGAGRAVTNIQGPSGDRAIAIPGGVTNVTVSGFTISCQNNYGIDMLTSDFVTITNNNITGSSTGIGISNENTSSPVLISGNNIYGNVIGINLSNSNINNPTIPLVISENVISGNTSYGILNYASSPTIISNAIIGNSYGIEITSTGTPSSARIINNTFIGNRAFGDLGSVDLFVDGTSTPNISFNVYNTITGGGRGLGQFNVTSTGGLAPAP